MAVSINERYTFIKQAGKGTYGTTWIAEDNLTGQTVAIKAMKKSGTRKADFNREFKYSKMLGDHSNIITTHDTAYETKACFVMVQDYAPGGDLFDAIEPDVGLGESKAKLYISQIAKALQFIHSKGLVHRDIKPENIVLGDRNEDLVQLIDFGLTLREGTHVPGVSGSIPYIPPEMYSASEDMGFFVDSSSDVWSVGILLFCMLTGCFPWEEATLSDPNYYEFVQWQNGSTVKPPHMWQNFSPRLLSLFDMLLARDPRERCEITEVSKYLKVSWFTNSFIPLSESWCEVGFYDHLTTDLSDTQYCVSGQTH